VTTPWKVVIAGGGFGGLRAAQNLRSDLVDVTLVDRRNYHLFQPLPYQAATGSLAPGKIASPLRGILSAQRNSRVLLGIVTDVDPESKRVFLEDAHPGSRPRPKLPRFLELWHQFRHLTTARAELIGTRHRRRRQTTEPQRRRNGISLAPS